jgi:hypothetical protein
MKRNICKIDGCNRLGRNKGMLNGKRIYGNVCEKHRSDGVTNGFNVKRNIENKKCEECGWDKAPCDRHRIIPILGYVDGNVKILCPNCHRIEEMKKYKEIKDDLE